MKFRIMDLAELGDQSPELAFNFGKVNIVAINADFINLDYMEHHIFQYDSIFGKFNGAVKAENGKIIINRKLSIFQE